MILIFSCEDEPSVNFVSQVLSHRGCQWFRLNGEDLSERSSMTYFPSRLPAQGVLKNQRGDVIRLDEVRAIWNRRWGTPRILDRLHPQQKVLMDQEFKEGRHALSLLLKDRFWVNPPWYEVAAQYKGHQLQVASRLGLKCPETIITCDPEEALEFYDRCEGDVMVKAVGGTGIVHGDETRELRAIYANRLPVGHRQSLEAVRFGLTALQRYVHKELELRVTIVGRKIFATAIDSQRSPQASEDWRRYDLPNTPHYPFRLPEDVQERLLALMEELNLVFGAVDLILERDSGDYVFLEVNPGGQWTWVEHLSGHPISEALADVLIQGAAA